MRKSQMGGFVSRIVIGALIASAGCGSSHFGGTDLEIDVTADQSLASQIQFLSLTLSGAESNQLQVPVAVGFASSGKQTVTYGLASTSGTISINVTGRTNSNFAIASGDGTSSLALGKVHAAIVLTETAVVPPDMSGTADGGIADLSTTPPAAVAIVPSHVSASRYDATAKPLSGVIAINTDNLSVNIGGYDVDGGVLITNPHYDGGVSVNADGGFSGTPLNGITFVVDNGYAVLSVGAWTVDKEIFVTGARPLIVVASGPVEVNRPIHVEANISVPGPGGGGPGSGNGAGSQTVITGSVAAGGGGAGFSTKGGNGGSVCQTSATTTPYNCTTTVPPPGEAATGSTAGGGVAGAVNGATIASLTGGSGGGNGQDTSSYDYCGYPVNTSASGGAGGGAFQISSGSRIRIARDGVINAGGGGAGQRHRTNSSFPCFPPYPYALCGGGQPGAGSGGTIFLEAREIVVEGVVASNGGSGAGPANFRACGSSGGSAPGGRNAGIGPYATPGVIGGLGLAGGSGGAKGIAPTDGAPTGSNSGYTAGGGGGAAGRIWFRLPAGKTADVTGNVSPDPSIDTTL